MQRARIRFVESCNFELLRSSNSESLGSIVGKFSILKQSSRDKLHACNTMIRHKTLGTFSLRTSQLEWRTDLKISSQYSLPESPANPAAN